eukprot:TRINITY_DN4358_c0_g1_i3.p1 TRINITY_DN4358_c0_g1~~TRINITY_DN4358_c0_g1_i3.p1  ORF type:complete len:315 (-),score=57.50 TRINITY_DN4358_c0_g1_i3:207-1151(-)
MLTMFLNWVGYWYFCVFVLWIDCISLEAVVSTQSTGKKEKQRINTHTPLQFSQNPTKTHKTNTTQPSPTNTRPTVLKNYQHTFPFSEAIFVFNKQTKDTQSIHNTNTQKYQYPTQFKNMVNILVGVDDSEFAVLACKRALRIAKPGEDTIYFLTVLGTKSKVLPRGMQKSLSSYEIGSRAGPSSGGIAHPKGSAEWHALENKRHFMRFCSEKGVKAVSCTEYGNPKDIIPRAVDEHHIDFVILGSRGHGSAKRAFLGSTCDYCLKVLRVPVLVVKQFEYMKEYGLPYAPYSHPSLPVAAPPYATGYTTVHKAQP